MFKKQWGALMTKSSYLNLSLFLDHEELPAYVRFRKLEFGKVTILINLWINLCFSIWSVKQQETNTLYMDDSVKCSLTGRISQLTNTLTRHALINSWLSCILQDMPPDEEPAQAPRLAGPWDRPWITRSCRSKWRRVQPSRRQYNATMFCFVMLFLQCHITVDNQGTYM